MVSSSKYAHIFEGISDVRSAPTEFSSDPDVSIRTRHDGVTELRVNGMFLMDNVETTSERHLADQALTHGAREILVGGLGLGYTARALLDGGAERVVVAELARPIVEAMQAGHIPGADILADERLTVEVGDVVDVVAAQPNGSLDAILMDVDNGPDDLVHERNAELYRDAFMAACRAKLRDHGHMAIWSVKDHPLTHEALERNFRHTESTAIPVKLGNESTEYWILEGSEPRRA